MNKEPGILSASPRAPRAGARRPPAGAGARARHGRFGGGGRWRGPAPLFDVCNIGVVLRTVLWTQALIAVAALFWNPPGWVPGSTSWPAVRGWLDDWGGASAVVLPAVLAWLLMACALGPRLTRWPAPALGLLGAGAGALGGVAAAGLWQAVWLQARGAPWLAAAAAGALAGLALVQALILRARARMPLDGQARAAELQARIQPHFLFNTLNSALALVRDQPHRAERLLEDLAELFRAALAQTSASTTLAAELALARRYLGIEQARFAERLQVRWEIDPGALQARLPPLLLQPLVENAVRHGVECSAAPVCIEIAARRQAGRVRIRIRNTLPQDGTARHDGQGLALASARARLGLLHDLEASFEAARVPGRGGEPDRFVVTLELPAGREAA